MRVLKHGKCLKFRCEACGCEWLANEDECEKNDHPLETSFTEWYYYCPDCRKWSKSNSYARGKDIEG